MNDEGLHPADDEFDATLRRALAARPEAALADDLAERAMRRAVAASRGLRRPAAVWRAVSSLAACLLIAGLLSLGAWRWYRSTATSADYVVTDTSSINTTDTSSSSQNATLLLLGGAALVATLGLITLDRMWAGDDAAGTPAFV